MSYEKTRYAVWSHMQHESWEVHLLPDDEEVLKGVDVLVPIEAIAEAEARGAARVLREIVKTVEMVGGQAFPEKDEFNQCIFCGNEGDHVPDCLWVRAQAAVRQGE